MKLILVFVAVFAFSRKARGLNEDLLETIEVFKQSVTFFGEQYSALSVSSRHEINSMSSNFNSRVLSRIGFVSQEIKDLEFQLANEIQDRATQINEDSECILQARRDLETSTSLAGKAIQIAAVGITEDVNNLNEETVYRILYDIDFLNSVFKVEILDAFAYFNSVLAIRSLIVTLESEVRLFGALFEYFVGDLYVEMWIWLHLTDELSLVAFPQFDAAVVEFRNSTNLIRTNLAACN